ncbi:uncharacterized protein LOC119584593 [Penaeus monodon]|uniref:uncharacterized protein LOC119584593 n=1 Tax=Penaeus monodon TaxID=6687 RepID=UPI0018A7B044|nr:uncharacterized protein LOC119584593 [Penaeus monodon]
MKPIEKSPSKMGQPLEHFSNVSSYTACVFAEYSSHQSQYVLPKEPSDCSSPYILIGGRCLLIDSVTKGTRDDMQALCQLFNGDLVKIDNMEIMFLQWWSISNNRKFDPLTTATTRLY